MPNTPEHKADMFTLSRERIAQGKPSWKERLDFTSIWHNEEVPLKERISEIVAIVKRSNWYKNQTDGDAYASGESLSSLIEELERTLDDEDDEDEVADTFNFIWDRIYDFADYDRIWLNTF